MQGFFGAIDPNHFKGSYIETPDGLLPTEYNICSTLVVKVTEFPQGVSKNIGYKPKYRVPGTGT